MDWVLAIRHCVREVQNRDKSLCDVSVQEYYYGDLDASQSDIAVSGNHSALNSMALLSPRRHTTSSSLNFSKGRNVGLRIGNNSAPQRNGDLPAGQLESKGGKSGAFASPSALEAVGEMLQLPSENARHFAGCNASNDGTEIEGPRVRSNIKSLEVIACGLSRVYDKAIVWDFF